MIQKNDVVMPQLVMRDVAVSVSQMLKEKNRIRRTEFAEHQPEKISLQSGRKAVIRRLPGRLMHPGLPCRGRH
jgi:hypothetical protein